MTKVAVNEESLMDIANAIRTQNGTQTTYKPSEMGDAIEALQPTVDADAVTVTADNTTQHVYPDTGKYFDEVVVNPITPIVHPEYASFYEFQGSTIDISWLRTDNITNMHYMFCNMPYLTSLNLSNFDTSRVTDMRGMFYYDLRLNPANVIGINNFNTSNVTNMREVFYQFNYYGTVGEELNLSNWKFSKTTTCYGMFTNVNVKKIVLNSNSNPYLTDAYKMFYGCNQLRNLDLSNFDLSRINSAANMFSSCGNLTNDSLNSIMGALIPNTGLSSSGKTLRNLGFTSTQANTMAGLSNWAALQNAGWSTGY